MRLKVILPADVAKGFKKANGIRVVNADNGEVVEGIARVKITGAVDNLIHVEISGYMALEIE